MFIFLKYIAKILINIGLGFLLLLVFIIFIMLLIPGYKFRLDTLVELMGNDIKSIIGILYHIFSKY